MDIYAKFDYIRTAYYNGALEQVKEDVKKLSRQHRYDLIMYSRGGVHNKGMSDYFMKICILADFG